MLRGKKILLGITGGIAAYKAAILVRLLVKEGAEVKVIMTESAKHFITPLTMATLTKNPILVEFFDPENGQWNSHVDIGLWADAYIIAPATANTIAKMAHGIADNLLVTSYLSARCPVFVAPTMDLDMYKHPTTTKNIETLKSYNNIIIEPAIGELASGLEGKGRMEEPENIVEVLDSYFSEHLEKSKLAGKKILITAGPTHEAIDPVRFIGNHSSGKMGYAIADEAVKRGARVLVVSGPVNPQSNLPENSIIRVTSAEEMYQSVMEYIKDYDVIVFSAAVADFTLQSKSKEKIKDKSGLMLNLVPTKDIAKEAGRIKSEKQILVGFALETSAGHENALQKLKAKNLDFIVFNSLANKGAGFLHDTNKITIIDKNNNFSNFELKSKKDVAVDILNKVEELFS